MKKIVVFLFFLIFIAFLAFAAIEEQILGLWRAETKDNEIQFLFRQDKQGKILQIIVISKDTGGNKMTEMYYIIKDRLILTTFAATGERWKVFFIKEVKLEKGKMTLVDLTPFVKNGDVSPLLDMIKKGEIQAGEEWVFSRE